MTSASTAQVAGPPAQRASTPTPRSKARSAFRPDIEGLRAIAVGLVVLGHAGFPGLDGGYVGVDVFFVISGFLITSLLLRELAGTGRISVAGFYARRATRLLPMAATVTVATLVASWLWLAPTRFASIAGDAAAGALYFVNYRLAAEGTEYLNADEAPSPFQHYWSLAVEEQFYLVWPLLLLSVGLMLRRSPELIRDGLTVALLFILGTTFAASAVLSDHEPVWSYFGLHTRGWELAIGALVALGGAACARIPHALAAALMWGGLAAIVWSAFTFDAGTVFPGTAAAVPVLGTAAVIAGGCVAPKAGAGGMLALPGFQVLGRLSYGLYLWHWPILMIGPEALGAEPTVRLNLVLVAAALGITAVTHEVVENPVRFSSWLKRRAWRGVGLGVALTAVSASAALAATSLFAPRAEGTGEAVQTPEIDTVAELGELVRESATITEAPSNLTPTPLDAKGDTSKIYGSGCHAVLEVVEFEPCVFGEEGSGTEIVLFGDSHAASWFPTLEILADEHGWKLTSYTKSGCPAPMIAKNAADIGGRYFQCEEWRERTIERIVEERPEMIVVGSSENNNPITDGLSADETWIEGWKQTLERLNGSGAEVVLPSNPPKFTQSVPDCVSANLADLTVCGGPTDLVVRHREREQQVLEEAERLGVHTIDVTDWFCADGFCPVVVGNMITHRDSHHFNVTYGEFLAPVLDAELPDID
ncbi:acyltransferase [Glycomyces sp. L485]|uniref:acyltransferase family protein n=1 Tax=Glycomyces sp. L485 TaxID=2909235 RepID=UPI001F4B650E|nr:acyltransferase family protein [Glycomyces sp. L485]MCH7231436.1 acyltransferase [Glycomyces sp. L485]